MAKANRFDENIDLGTLADPEEIDEEGDETETGIPPTLDTLLSNIKKQAVSDIFVDIGNKCADYGLHVKYTIKKHGQYLCEKMHPYSWDRLKREFGGGHYSVQARHPNNGSFIKQQTEAISDEGAARPEPEAPQSPQSYNPGPTVIDPTAGMANLVGQLLSSQTTLMQALLTKPAAPADSQGQSLIVSMIQTSQTQNMEMIRMMLDSQKNSTAEMSKLIEKVVERLDTKIDKLASGNTRKSPLDDVNTIMTLMTQSRKEGQEMMMQLEEMAERKAQTRGGGSEEGGSFLDKIAAYAPKLIELGLMSQAGKQVQATAAPRPALRAAPPPQRPRPVLAPAPVPQAGVRPVPPPPRAPENPGIEIETEGSGFDFTGETQGAFSTQPSDDSAGQVDLLMNKWLPIIAPGMEKMIAPGDVTMKERVDTARRYFRDAGISVEQFPNEVSLPVIMREASGLPTAIKEQIEALYADILARPVLDEQEAQAHAIG